MTIGIAAICKKSPDDPGGRMIILASDRMYSFGGRAEYEPRLPKSGLLSQTCTILISGDPTAHIPAYKQTLEKVTPNLGVPEIAKMYGEHLAQVRKERAHTTFLTPLGMTEADLKSGHPLAENVAQDILGYHLDADAIIAGIAENGGAHLFTVDRDGIEHDMSMLGFATIGSGADYAESEFLKARYAASAFVAPSTIWLAYMAKRRAELAQGVGLHTDMRVVHSASTIDFDEQLVEKLRLAYEQAEQQKQAIDDEVVSQLASYFGEMSSGPGYSVAT